MVDRIFLMLSSVLTRAMRRSGGLHLLAGRCVRGKYPAAKDGMPPRRWDKSCQARDAGKR
jgi:hypothetical protein